MCIRDRGAQQPGKLLQDLVAAQMAVAVVDVLEKIQVDDQHSAGGIGTVSYTHLVVGDQFVLYLSCRDEKGPLHYADTLCRRFEQYQACLLYTSRWV